MRQTRSNTHLGTHPSKLEAEWDSLIRLQDSDAHGDIMPQEHIEMSVRAKRWSGHDAALVEHIGVRPQRRQNDADASGAANWGKIFNVVSGVGGAAGLLGSLAGNHDQQQKREEIIELLSRQSSTDDSGAANWGKILNIAGGVGSATSLLGSLIPNHDQQPPKRAEALIARQQGEADSGAANWGKVADVGSKVISGLGTAAGIGGTGVSVWDKLHGGQKREDLVEFLAREDP